MSENSDQQSAFQLPVTEESCCGSESHQHSAAVGDSGKSAQVQTGCCGGKLQCESQTTEVATAVSLNEDTVREQLKKVIDPELFVNIVDLGLVYVVDLKPSQTDSTKQDVSIDMTLTSPMCPAGPQLVSGCRQVVEAMDGVASVDVKVVMDPPWSPDRMTEDARDQLNIF